MTVTEVIVGKELPPPPLAPPPPQLAIRDDKIAINANWTGRLDVLVKHQSRTKLSKTASIHAVRTYLSSHVRRSASRVRTAKD